MALFSKPKFTTLTPSNRRRDIPEGLWIKCEECGNLIYKKEWEDALKVCPKCNWHFQLRAEERLKLLLEKDSFKERELNLSSRDFLSFEDTKKYGDRIIESQKKSGLLDAALVGEGKIGKHQIAIGLLDFSFMGGSMGSVVGEKVTRLTEYATKEHLPLIIVSCSGGARMQEGIVSLMQMAKTSSAISRFSQKGGFFISLLTNPTTGGITASFASLGDIIIAEPKALIGFAGPRVIEQTIGKKLPPSFQRSEFCLSHGLIDMIVCRKEIKSRISQLLDFFIT